MDWWIILLCSICEQKPARYVCKMCGRNVCEDDYILEKGVCKICGEALCEICGKYLSIGYCRVCGRMGCEECLIHYDQVSYICIDCLKKQSAGRGDVFEGR